MTRSIDVHMRETDSFSWSMETDPRLRMNVVTVATFDGRPPWEVIATRFERLTRAAPMFRQRVVPTPGRLAPPKWVVDERFDLAWHLRRVIAPQPATLETVLEFGARMATEAFDPARPLWEVWLVDGLADGGSALVIKVHHTLTDGLGGLQLLAHLFDVDGTPLATGALPPPPAPGTTSRLAMARGAVAHDLAQAWVIARGAADAAGRTASAARRDPRQAALGALATWRSVFESIAPTGDRLSPLMTQRGLARRYATVDVPLEGLRAAARAGGGSVNDAYLTAITGGLRRYHALHATTIGELRATVPISVRGSDDPVAGNRIALIRMLVPALPEDPVRRMPEVGRRMGHWKDAPGLAYIEPAYGAINTLPASYLQRLCRSVDFVASNVPGFPMPVGFAGPRLTAFYPFGPTGGTAVNITMMSYAATCHIGVNADVAAIPDVDAFVTCLRAGFDEVLAMGHRPRRQRAERRESLSVAR